MHTEAPRHLPSFPQQSYNAQRPRPQHCILSERQQTLETDEDNFRIYIALLTTILTCHQTKCDIMPYAIEIRKGNE